MIYVTCECGARILLVPDIEEMARSIVVHARRHVRNEVNPKKAEIERCRIEEMLTEKVLSTASANEEEFIAV